MRLFCKSREDIIRERVLFLCAIRDVNGDNELTSAYNRSIIRMYKLINKR